jgi:hypothetical protein
MGVGNPRRGGECEEELLIFGARAREETGRGRGEMRWTETRVLFKCAPGSWTTHLLSCCVKWVLSFVFSRLRSVFSERRVSSTNMELSTLVICCTSNDGFVSSLSGFCLCLVYNLMVLMPRL